MEKTKAESFRTIPERVKQFYYKIGLFCSSYPHAILVLSTSIILFSCYPLLHLPLPGGKPQEFSITSHNSFVNSQFSEQDIDWPRWMQQQKGTKPIVFIQQVIIKSYLHQSSNQTNSDFHQALHPVFPLLEAIRSVPGWRKTCFHAYQIKSRLLKAKSMLPENKCLVVSPANFWQEDIQKFESDTNILGTILNYQSHEKGRSGLAEILLGMNVRETGLKISPFSRRNVGSKSLTYAITIVLRHLDDMFLSSLKSKLVQNNCSIKLSNKTSYIYYPPSTSYVEFIPLASIYTILFIYIYFSVKKIEIIHSKLGVTFSALLTIIASLCMSIGLCSSFGPMLNFNMNSKTIFPYLIGIVGLENVLVMTRSVVSTNADLDVKIRFAQGLSKEGWSITKNLLTEVTILTIGFFTFFPRIQEFCILAIVGLLSDFFLQTFFYGTILSLDIRRTENSTHRYTQPLRMPVHPNLTVPTIPSSPNAKSVSNPSVVVAPSAPPYIAKIPKRLRLIYFWAKTRIFQRTFMILMVGWISIIVYEVISFNFLLMDPEFEIVLPKHVVRNVMYNNLSGGNTSAIPVSSSNLQTPNNFEFIDGTNNIIKRSSYWQSLISIYNVSVTGRYLQVLPPINLYLNSKNIFNVNNKFNWDIISRLQSQPQNLDALNDHSQLGATTKALYPFDDPYVPTSPMELTLTLLLAIPSFVFLCYSMVVFYRCICSRNYAEWRSSWYASTDKNDDSYTQVVFEAVPLVLSGHLQEVECMGCDGATIASVCLNGVLKIWNVNAENIASVDRKRYFEGTDNEETDNEEEIKLKKSKEHVEKQKMSKQPVWCLDINHRIIALGTGTGRLEIWDSFSGALRGSFDDGIQSGIVCVKIIDTRIVIARLNGSLDFIQLESCDGSNNRNNSRSNQQSNPYHRWSGLEEGQHSAQSISSILKGDELRCIWLTTLRAHQQPITCLDSEGVQIVTGSQDHSLKVFRLQDTSHVYTLHGHYGPITCLFIDKESPTASGSGSQDGMLCVWDLQTGTCVYSIQAHDGPTIGLTYSTSYIISVGGDDKICVWERFQGHLLNTIQLDHAYSSSLVMLTYNLLITSKQGSLVVWDVQKGEPVRSIRLGHRDNTVFVRQIINCGGAVLCDYGAQLRLVRFPSIINKFE